jgi:hypothetical protein
VTPCSPVESTRMYDRNISACNLKVRANLFIPPDFCCLPVVLFYHEDGGDEFLRNVGELLSMYTAMAVLPRALFYFSDKTWTNAEGGGGSSSLLLPRLTPAVSRTYWPSNQQWECCYGEWVVSRQARRSEAGLVCPPSVRFPSDQ